MADRHFSHEMWLSKLGNHLTEERYAARTSRQCLAVARHFLRCLDKQHVDVSAAQPASVERYLRQARRMYRRRHGHPPDYKGWRCLHTNGIHMLLRLVQGQWPPVPRSVTPVEILQSEIPRRVRLMDGRSARPRSGNGVSSLFRGRASSRLAVRASNPRGTCDPHPPRCGRLCEVSGRVGRQAFAQRCDHKIRSFLRWLHMTEQTSRDLSSTVIAPLLYAFESIPSALRSEDVKEVLAVTRQDCTPKGIRDYAILMLISKYGVRSGASLLTRSDPVALG